MKLRNTNSLKITSSENNKWCGGRSGIVNLGQTCYMSTAIQLLLQIQELKELFLNDNYLEDLNISKINEYKFCNEFSRLMKGMWEENCVVQPVSFRKSLINLDNKYSGYEQHDLSETLGIIIDSLHIGISYEANISYNGVPKNKLDKLMIISIMKWSNIYKNESSSILDLFYGQYILKINNKTSGVKKISYNFDPFNILTLPINDCKNIYDCLDKFILPEYLDDEKKITSSLKLWKSPQYLIIQLKRFDGLYKNFSFIEYPIDNLNLNKYNIGYDKDNSIYELIGVGIHLGTDNNGHYISLTKHNDEWYEFDDSNIYKISIEDINKKIINKNAYILMYKKY